MSIRTALLLAVTAISAACGLVIEIVAGRMIAPYLGMSLYTWTAIIAVVLAGFSIGHWIGGRIAEQPPTKSIRSVGWSLLFAAISSTASLLLIRVLSGPIINLGLGPVPTILTLTTALFFLPSLFVGIPSPALTRLAIEENKEHLGHTLGIFYAAGAAGSIVGTLAAGYIFIAWLGIIGTILTVSTAYLLMAGVMFSLNWRVTDARGRTMPVVIALVATGTVMAGGNRLLAFTSNCDVESSYYCIRVIDLDDQIGVPARSMVLDHLAHGVNVRDEAELLLSPYVEAQDTLARLHLPHGSSFQGFFIGGGAYTLPRAWLAARPRAQLHVAEIDPVVTRVAQNQMWLTKTDRLKIVHADARRALRENNSIRFDVVVGDAFHDISIPQHLVTSEFFSLIHKRLKPQGIYLMNVVDHLERPRLALSIVKSLEATFPVVEMWRSNWSGKRATFVIAALKRQTPVERLNSKVTPGQSFNRLQDAEIRRLSNSLQPFKLTDNYAPVDRLIAVH